MGQLSPEYWDSGLFQGVADGNAIIVVTRDIDPPEWALLGADRNRLLGVAPDTADALRTDVAGRVICVHIDCDVF